MSELKDNILGRETIGKLFLKYSIPSVLAMLITGSQTIIDGLFVGNLIGPNALAAVNIVQPFIQIVLGVSFVVSIGILSIIGRKLGAGKNNDARDAFRTATIILGIISILTSVFSIIFHRQIASVLGASPKLVGNVSTYLFYISMFFPFVSLNILFGFACRMVEKPERYLAGSIMSLFVNIVLDYVLIKVVGLGMSGAAIATGIAYSLSFFVVIAPLFDRKKVINIFVGEFKKEYIVPMFYNGGSEGIISIAAALTTYLFNMTFMKIAGEAGVVAFTTINYLYQFGIMTIFGISDGIGSIISFNYGKERLDRVNKLFYLAMKVQFAIGICLFGLMFIRGENLIQLFSNLDSNVLTIATNGSKLFAFTFLISGFNIISSGFFTSVGDAKASIVISIIRGLIFIPIGIYILPMIIGMKGIWLTVPTAEIMTGIVSIGFLTGFYKRHRILNKNDELAKGFL